MPRAALIAALLLAASPALAQTAVAPAPVQAPAAAAAHAARPAAVPAALAANQFTTEAAAQAHCAADSIVWVNPRSKAYHLKGTRYYGHTRTGAYMCHKDADAGGMHATPGEKPATTASAH